mmetsp:Transcript_1446/g.3387  ORF Transcript_1446/g.3387 Transcript_1446/m.3387 type:complete len:268 (-) Transcript_1446:1149-1952(-)
MAWGYPPCCGGKSCAPQCCCCCCCCLPLLLFLLGRRGRLEHLRVRQALQRAQAAAQHVQAVRGVRRGTRQVRQARRTQAQVAAVQCDPLQHAHTVAGCAARAAAVRGDRGGRVGQQRAEGWLPAAEAPQQGRLRPVVIRLDRRRQHRVLHKLHRLRACATLQQPHDEQSQLEILQLAAAHGEGLARGTRQKEHRGRQLVAVLAQEHVRVLTRRRLVLRVAEVALHEVRQGAQVAGAEQHLEGGLLSQSNVHEGALVRVAGRGKLRPG